MAVFTELTLFLMIIGFCSFSTASEYRTEASVIDELTSSSDVYDCDEITTKTKAGLKTKTVCYFPSKILSDKDIYVVGEFVWNKKDGENKDLILNTKGNIIFDESGKIINKSKGDASIILKSGMEPGKKRPYSSTVIFKGKSSQVEMFGNGKVKIFYNPTKGNKKHKYHNPIIYDDMLPNVNLETYMLVNSVYDLQGITACLYGTFALSQNIDASPTKKWNCTKDNVCSGFYPIMDSLDKAPFSGTFDGNNYRINNLFIYRPDETNVGLFGDATGVNEYKSTIKNVWIVDSDITGKRCVGGVVGQATGVKLLSLHTINNTIHSILSDNHSENRIKGRQSGCVFGNTHANLTDEKNGISTSDDDKLFGSCVRCNIDDDDDTEEGEVE
jgi:hypothetical protein